MRLPSHQAHSRLGGLRAILLAFLILAVAAPPLTATNFGSGINHACDDTTASQCVADNYLHVVFDRSLTTNWYNAVNDAINAWDADATLIVGWGVSGSGDVDAYDYNYGANGLWGWTLCADGASYGGSDPDRWCKPQDANFNEYYSQTSSQKKVIARHELGHTVGLRHAPNSGETYHDVMVANQRSYLTISTHDHDLIAGQYN